MKKAVLLLSILVILLSFISCEDENPLEQKVVNWEGQTSFNKSFKDMQPIVKII